MPMVTSSSSIAVKLAAVRSGELTHKMSSKSHQPLRLTMRRATPQERVTLLASLALPNLMDSSLFIFPQIRGRGAIKLTHKREQCVTPFHPALVTWPRAQMPSTDNTVAWRTASVIA